MSDETVMRAFCEEKPATGPSEDGTPTCGDETTCEAVACDVCGMIEAVPGASCVMLGTHPVVWS